MSQQQSRSAAVQRIALGFLNSKDEIISAATALVILVLCGIVLNEVRTMPFAGEVDFGTFRWALVGIASLIPTIRIARTSIEGKDFMPFVRFAITVVALWGAMFTLFGILDVQTAVALYAIPIGAFIGAYVIND
jgi:hypothetical protein